MRTCLKIFAGLTGLLLACPPAIADDAAPEEGAPEQGTMGYPASGCPKIVTPDSLRQLAQVCAKNLNADANCRVHITEGLDEYVVVRDCSPKKPQGFLIIPVQPATGIEDSHVFSPPLVDLWEDAWRWAKKYPGQPPEKLALAINSKNARSQNQLHIHISCVLPEVSQMLEQAGVPFYPAGPARLQLGPDRNDYTVVKVKTLSGENSPFKVAASFDGAAGHMEDQSIAVVGSKNPDEFYVLDTTSGGTNRGHAEELLEQTCR